MTNPKSFLVSEANNLGRLPAEGLQKPEMQLSLSGKNKMEGMENKQTKPNERKKCWIEKENPETLYKYISHRFACQSSMMGSGMKNVSNVVI